MTKKTKRLTVNGGLTTQRPRLTIKDKPKPPRTTISVSLKFSLRDELKVMADEEATSVAAIIEGLLKYYRENEGLNDE